MAIEFKVGDIVTYKPYDKSILMYVRGWHKHHLTNEIIYGLGEKSTSVVTTYTTGKSIVQSKLYKDYKYE